MNHVTRINDGGRRTVAAGVDERFLMTREAPLSRRRNSGNDPKPYRPIANLSVLSKLLERLVARQLLNYLNAASLLPERQSAYRAYHSTETAVTKILADILLALDKGDIALLALLDLSAAFDSVDHAILLRRLEVSYGL